MTKWKVWNLIRASIQKEISAFLQCVKHTSASATLLFLDYQTIFAQYAFKGARLGHRGKQPVPEALDANLLC